MKMKVLAPFILLGTLLLSSCANIEDKTAEIKPMPDSDYVKTFEELNLGNLFDFEFELENADKRWVRLWVERYQDGEKDREPITELMYGQSPISDETSKGHVGFGIIQSNESEPSYFLYAPGVSSAPNKSVEKTMSDTSMTTWDYAFPDEKVDLLLNEEKVLAAYRSTSSNQMRTYDLGKKDDVEKMIQEDTEVLLLKIKIKESDEDN